MSPSKRSRSRKAKQAPVAKPGPKAPQLKVAEKDPMALARHEGIYLDLDRLKARTMAMPIGELARSYVDLLPRLKQALNTIEEVALSRMDKEQQEEIPIFDPETGELDGRKVKVVAPISWRIDGEELAVAQKEFRTQGLGKHPDVASMVRTIRTVHMDDEALNILGIQVSDLLKLGERLQVSTSYAGRMDCKRLAKLGGKGAKHVELAQTKTTGTPRLKVEGKRRVDLAEMPF